MGMRDFLDMDTVWLEDDVYGRRGVAVDIEHGVESDNPDIDHGVKVEFIDPVDVFRHPIRLFKALISVSWASVTTDEIYPAEAVNEKSPMDGGKRGQPRRVLHIEEDEHGKAPWREKLGEERDEKIATLQAKVNRLERELDNYRVQEADQVGMNQGSETPENRQTIGADSSLTE